MSALNEKQKALIGKWESKSSENFEAFLKELGVPEEKLAKAGTHQSIIDVTLNGDVWTIALKSEHKSVNWTYKIGEKFERESFGKSHWHLVTMDDNGKQTDSRVDLAPGDKPVVFTRHVEGDEMILHCKAGGVEAKRVFKRI